jgi:potassium-dependent mechanosensitive channel
MRIRLGGVRSAARVLAALWLVFLLAGTVAAETPNPPPQPSFGLDSVRSILDTAKSTLDEVDESLKAELLDETLADIRRRLTPMRSDLRGAVETLESNLNEVVSHLKQLGEPPASDDTPEDPNIVAERERLEHEQGELDSTLKNARYLATRADDLSSKVNDLRRGLFARELLARSAGLFNPTFWKEVSEAVPAEAARLGQLLRAWWISARDSTGRGAWIGAILTLLGFAVAAVLVVRWWRVRLTGERPSDRFHCALQALLVMVGETAAMPALLTVVVLVLENYGLMPAWIRNIGVGTATAVATATFGRGVASGLFAPGRPQWRLFDWSDSEASRLASHLTWSARFLGLAIFLNLLHKTTAAPISLTVATSALLALSVVAIGAHLLWRSTAIATGAATATGPGQRGLRVLLIFTVAAIAIVLAAGYIALAAFVSGRLVVALALAGGLIVANTFIDALFTELLAGDSERGRAVAALLGVSRRGLDVLATLFSAVTRLILLMLAVLAVIGPWGVFADDMFGALAEAAFGWHIAGASVSIQTLFGALAILLLGVLAVRGVQPWLTASFLPRTALDPGLQHSISALFGYAGLIAVLSAVLGAFGIDLQKIALIAGALSVGIGFGLQSIVSNFVSGLILLAERPIRVGDLVNVKNEEGIVRRISVRATEIETFDRASVIIPNSEFITGVVKNWTHANTLGRITLKARVAFGSDVEKIRGILSSCALENPKVLRSPPPGVYLMGFGDIGLDFELRCILANVEDALSVKSDLHVAVLRRFRDEGIRIPQPGHEEHVPGLSQVGPTP